MGESLYPSKVPLSHKKLTTQSFLYLLCSFVKFVAECFECSEEFAKNWLKDKYGKISSSGIVLCDDIVIKQNKMPVRMPASYLDAFQDWHPYLAQRKLSREV